MWRHVRISVTILLLHVHVSEVPIHVHVHASEVPIHVHVYVHVSEVPIHVYVHVHVSEVPIHVHVYVHVCISRTVERKVGLGPDKLGPLEYGISIYQFWTIIFCIDRRACIRTSVFSWLTSSMTVVFAPNLSITLQKRIRITNYWGKSSQRH